MKFMKSLFGTSPPLRPAGPAPFAQPQQRDREALFWWLKRNTSHTAFAANAALWAEFAREFETCLRSRNDTPPADIETLKFALDTQLSYERGLKRLRAGDRSVFDRSSSEGWLARLSQSLIARRLEWVGPADVMAKLGGFPVSTVISNYIADQAVAAMGDFTLYESMGYPPGSARQMLAKLPFDTTVPEPRWDVFFAPGTRAPVDGIFEMVGSAGHIVGAMRYSFKGQLSEDDEDLEFGPDAGQRSSAFVWRLVWEDDRYKDGQIPAEEALYPSPSDSANMAAGSAVLEKIRCDSPQPCPRAGFWSTPAQPNSRRRFQKGETMPALSSDYGTTIWQWDADQES